MQYLRQVFLGVFAIHTLSSNQPNQKDYFSPTNHACFEYLAQGELYLNGTCDAQLLTLYSLAPYLALYSSIR